MPEERAYKVRVTITADVRDFGESATGVRDDLDAALASTACLHAEEFTLDLQDYRIGRVLRDKEAV